MSRKKLRRTKRQRMTLEQAYGAIRETMPEVAEVVQQHAQSTQKALDFIGQIISTRGNVNGMTLEQAYGAIRETMPEAAEVVQQHAQSTQKAINQAGQIMSASDKNGMTLKQARSTIQETMPEATEVVLEHTQKVQKILSLVDGIMKYVRTISNAIKRRLAPGRKTHSAKKYQRMTLEQAYGAIRETMPEAAEVVQQHAQSTQKAIDLIGRIMSASDKNGMTLEQACGAIRETMPEVAKVVQQRAQSTQKAIDHAGRIMSASDKNGMTLKQARSTIETMPEAAEVVQQHAQGNQKAIDLIGRIMSAPDNMNGECTRHFNDFGRLLKNDYRKFARNDTYPEEAEAYAALERIHSHMNQMRLAPRLASRNICTVAGSFSSGKSSFLNALIGDEILPTKITPTTSIPTFITHVDENELEINVFNSGGGKTPINTSTLQQMTHEFERDYGIPLTQIVERVVINTPHLGRCKQVAFIDTPGYTKPDDAKSDEEDKKIALQEVLTNPFLIWVVDCERGTLPQEDVDFLCEFRDQRKSSQISSYRKSKPPIFIVLNKADKKLTEKRKILREVKNVADKNKLPYFGIGFYSSHDKKEYGYSGRSLDDFLEMIDRSRTAIKLDKEIENLFDKYVGFHEDSYKNMKSVDGLMIRIGMIIDEEPAHRNLRRDVSEYKQDVIEAMNEHKEHADQSYSLKLKFGKCTQAFMDEINTMQNA